MEPLTQATLESCVHTFCFECIKQWATTAENTCPLCKQKFNSIKYTAEDGAPQTFYVENKKQRIDDDGLLIVDEESEDFCYVCQLDERPELMIICDACSYHVAHTYCLGFGDTIPEDDWVCGYCNGEIDDDSYESGNSEPNNDSELDDVDSDEMDFIQRNARTNAAPRFLQTIMDL